MNSGKSLQLLATANNFAERGISFLLLKSSLDTRDGENVIHSRALQDRECITVTTGTNIYTLVSSVNNMYNAVPLKWVLVDEAQFLTPTQVDELAAVADNFCINVICYGLRTDFQTNLFPASKRLFEIADTMEEIKSSCSCGSKTIFNARINEYGDVVTIGNQVEVGGEDKYISLCRKCYNQRIGNPYYENEEE